MTTCPTCTREYPTTDADCPHCAELDALLAEWADLLAQWAAYDEAEATDRYNAAQWALSGTNYNDGWFTGYSVGR